MSDKPLQETNCCTDDEKDKIASNNEIAKIVFEMVDIASEKAVERDLASDKTHNGKSDALEENDVPVRRSNRIRKSVVKKDEVTIPVAKKTNKGQRRSDAKPNQKNVELSNQNLESESKSSTESLNEKTLSNKSSKSDQPKEKRVPPKSVQNEKKKKPVRKNKRSEKNQNSVDDSKSSDTERSETPLPSLKDAVSEDNRCESAEENGSDAAEKSSESNTKPVKVKSRWWRSSELEAVMKSEEDLLPLETAEDSDSLATKEEACEGAPPQSSEKPAYDHIEENIYRFNRKKCKSKKQVRRMVCDCTLTKEEQEYGVLGCKEECLNRLLMIECGSRCPLGDACSNKKFQKKEYAKAEIFKTEKKGWGLRTLEDISAGDFVLEFVGEILNHREYRQRVKQYAKNVHSYFMALRPDEILDATLRGNHSRFINHSCDPNCETQKWTVNGELRVGVFAKRAVCEGEELTLDYKFQRYGREAQKCYCGTEMCSGFIGASKQISIEAYSSGSKSSSGQPVRKRKGSEDKKREHWEEEDIILEEEIERLKGGLRNREDTLKLARLMVRADDDSSRHTLLDIILKTEEQACLRLFLDYHGLPLLWSWMTDVYQFQLKAKILQVLSLLPISNKTMLLDSKVMSIVEKWLQESSEDPTTDPEKSAASTDADSLSKKMKIADFSDSETDSTSSHTVTDSNVAEMNPASVDGGAKTSTEGECCPEESEDPNSDLKQNIASLASSLVSNWKNLKEVFRIPRLEQQKRKEDEMEVDAKEENNKVEEEVKCGDQIQVVISGKNIFSDHRRGGGAYDFESDVKLEDCPRRFPRTPAILAKPRQVGSKQPVRHQIYPKDTESPKEDIPKIVSDLLSPPLTSPQQTIGCPLLTNPPPVFTSQPPPTAYPPPNAAENVPSQQQILYPPQLMYPPSQLPFANLPTSTTVLPPHNLPPPVSITAQPPLIQQPPIAAGLPPCQSLPPPSQPNVMGQPPNPTSFMLPPPASFVPGQQPRPFPPPVAGQVYAPGQNPPPLYFIPPQTNNPPPVSFPENQPLPVVKEESKKLPKNWRTATDSEGNVYYYHSLTRQTQWDPPSEEDSEEEDSNSEESESSDTPTYDEPKILPSSRHSKKKRPRKRKPTKAAADTSVVPIRPEVAKKIKELFRTKMSTYIVYCLNTYRKSDCRVGRITSNEDFKYLARKLTHYTMTKELKQCKNVEDLDCNETVMHKAKDFIKKYMAKYGPQYTRKDKANNNLLSPPP